MSIPDVGLAFAFAVLVALLIAAIGFWYGGKTERKKLAKERGNLNKEEIIIKKQEGENKKMQIKLEEDQKSLEKKEKEIEEKWASCPLTEEKMYKAMDVVTKIAEERQVPFYSVLDFIRKSGGKVSLGTLLSQFNISHTTISLLCTELQESKLLEKDSGNEVVYVLTPLGEEVVERFNAFFCFVVRKNLMMEAA